MASSTCSSLSTPEHFNFAVDVFDQWAKTTPQAKALWSVSGTRGDGAQFSFAEMARLSRKAANFLRSSGIGEGDRVLLMLPRIPQWWIAMLGLIRLGAVPVPATLLLTRRDLEYRLQTARVRGVLTVPEGINKLEGFDGIRILAQGSEMGWDDFDQGVIKASEEFTSRRTRASDPGILYFTSATTGEPKMVMHSQASYGLGHRLTGDRWLDLKPGDVHWNLSDLGWGKAAWSSFYGPWHQGACVFALETQGKFDPGLTLQTLATFPITNWCAPPTALRLIVRQDLTKWSAAQLRHCVTAGEPLNPEVLKIWHSATGLTLHEGYGQTETVILAGHFRSSGFPVVAGSMGRPVPEMNVVIVDEDLRELPPGEEGEIAVRVKPDRPQGLFQEYWENPLEMSKKFRGDYYFTGDRAVRAPDGYLWFLGRKDDVIKSSGYRIGPFEVESALLEHPGVLDVAVIGKPDPLRGHIVAAFVVLRPGHNPSEALKSELQVHCKRLIAAYKYPREIEFVSELPKTTSGKTRHVALRQQFATPSG